MYSMLTLLRVNKKRNHLKSGDIVALKPAYAKDFKEICLNDQLSIKSITGEVAEVSFISTKTKKLYSKTLPEMALVKIS
jgi:hypothetical protein